MRLITRLLNFEIRNIRSRKQKVQSSESAKEFQKSKFSEEEITEMGQYRMRPKSRHFKNIFKDKLEEKKHEEYLKKQKENIKTDEFDDLMGEGEKFTPKKQRTSKHQKKQNLRTFKIYQHVDRLKDLYHKKQTQNAQKGSLINEQTILQQKSRVRLNEQYLPYQYMKNVQKVFHKYDQTNLRDVAFHFTNLMKLRYNQEKIDYDQYEGLEFQKLEEKLPYHRKVEQIYLTSKDKALEVREETRKIDDEPLEQDIKYSQNIIVSYLLNRVPRTYAVAYRTINQVRRMFDTFKPTSFIDFGAGLSSGSAAFVEHFGNNGSIFSVEPVGKMRKMAKFLTAYSNIIQFQSLAELSSQVKQVDMVYCGYVLNQLRPQLVVVYLEALLAKVKPQGFLILTEYGNPFGSRLIHQSRKWALTKKIKIVAPCPHHHKCPLSSSKHWCHFDQSSGMLPRQVFGKLPSENSIKNQKFSYIIIQKLQEEEDEDRDTPQIPTTPIQANETAEWDRVLFPLMRKGQHFIFSLCTKNGRFEKRIAAKSHGWQYKEGRKLRWGDFWRFGFRIPNRYRKERATGRRLW